GEATGETRDAVVRAALASAVHLMTKSQVSDVKAAVAKAGAGVVDADAFAGASEVVGRCGEDAGCYRAALVPPDAAQGELGAVKAADMVGIYGGAAAA